MSDLLFEKTASSFRSDHGLNSADPIRLKSLNFLQKVLAGGGKLPVKNMKEYSCREINFL